MTEERLSIGLPGNLFARKTAIVTGASRGVGRATALRLAEGGANVVVNFLSNEAEATETVKLCEDKGAQAIVVQADVSEFSGAQAIVKQTLERFGLQCRCVGRCTDRGNVRGALEQGHQYKPQIRLGDNEGVRAFDEKTTFSGDRDGVVNFGSARRGELLELLRIERRNDLVHQGSCE